RDRRAGLDVAQPALGDVHELAVARDLREVAGELPLVHVALVVAVDAGEAFRGEAGLFGVDLDVEHARMFPSFVQAGRDSIPRTSIGRRARMRRLLVALVVLLAAPTAARADTVVALGDSAISGEAGRWAGNTNQSSS